MSDRCRQSDFKNLTLPAPLSGQTAARPDGLTPQIASQTHDGGSLVLSQPVKPLERYDLAGSPGGVSISPIWLPSPTLPGLVLRVTTRVRSIRKPPSLGVLGEGLIQTGFQTVCVVPSKRTRRVHLSGHRHWWSRQVVPSLALGWSHAAGATQRGLVPCCWRATRGVRLSCLQAVDKLAEIGTSSNRYRHPYFSLDLSERSKNSNRVAAPAVGAETDPERVRQQDFGTHRHREVSQAGVGEAAAD
jgi:hypothetical protein